MPESVREGARIVIHGAREHNLAGVDLEIPRDALTTITGVSGSGKSSLAFDTLHREGQRRFFESLAPYARQFLGPVGKPRVDGIEGLSPTIAIDQRGLGRKPRSTVGTATEIHDFLRLLFARLGVPHCPRCGGEVRSQGPDRITDALVSLGGSGTAVILAPVVRDRKGEHRKELEDLRLRGYVRVRIDGEIRRLEELEGLDGRRHHTIEVVVDRIRTRAGSRSRVAEAVELALREGGGVMGALVDGALRLFGTSLACPACAITLPEPEPRLFSFHSRQGACPSCRGLGRSGAGGQGRGATCPACGGTRLAPAARAVRLGGRSLPEVCALPVDGLLGWLRGVRRGAGATPVGRPILGELVQRVAFLREAGLGYLTLDRPVATLAGGEAQRIRLARQVGSGLRGVLYVLDEPSVGLHPRDQGRLLGILRRLRDLGNTVVVVEHDAATILASDHVVDLGPGAGRRGGRVVASGPVRELLASRRSLTAAYLRGERRTAPRRERRRPDGRFIRVLGARAHNLRGIDAAFPVGLLTVVTGVSGSGKSTLVDLVLQRALRRALGRPSPPPGAHKALEGHEAIDRVLEIDAGPLGRSPRSNPATYTGLFAQVRGLFALAPEARMRGYTPARFSFNVPGGRCEACGGAGVREIDMQLLASIQVPCDACGGKRFHPETLGVRFKGKSILDVLEMSVDEALALLAAIPAARRILETLREVGLGYLSLGRPSTTLSGGEAQRVKLARELARPRTGRTLYLLDEPTTGLHFDDVRKLLGALDRLVAGGNTVIVIEHDLDVVRCADWVLDLGPEGGEGGGRLVAAGPPEALERCRASRTGAALRAARTPPLPPPPRPPRGRSAPRGGRGAGRKAPGIRVTRARTHNLKDVTVHLPEGRLTVISGPSGSGKSSLALDTLFAEGQRRFVESLSTYARRFLGRLERPPVERIEGLRPCIAVEHGSPCANPRSTVATATRIHDHLRLLFARVGRRHCPGCGKRLGASSPSSAAAELARRLEGETLLVLAPLYLPRSPVELSLPDPSRLGELARDLRREGFLRLLIGGEVVRIDEWLAAGGATRPAAPARAAVYLVVDRVRSGGGARGRLADSLEQAFSRGHGIAALRREGRGGGEGGKEEFLTSTPACVPCGFAGEREVAPRSLSFNSRAGACPRCEGLGRLAGRSGTRGHENGGGVCPACGGARLRPEPLAIRIGGRNIAEVCRLTVGETVEFLEEAPRGGIDGTVAAPVIAEIRRRLSFLERVGLSYLTLERPTATLSGGEARRIRLATRIGGGLAGILYLLDEPSSGLHPSESERLVGVLLALRDQGNTVVAAGNARALVAAADHVVDLGPGGGRRGGRVVYEGSARGLAGSRRSLSGAHLSGRLRIPVPSGPRAGSRRILRVRAARAHNLRGIDVEFRRGLFHAITGVSGSGKTSLLLGVLLPNVRACLRDRRPRWRDCGGVSGTEGIERVLAVGGRPVGRTPASCAATLLGILDGIRDLFARTPLARMRGYGKERFSMRAPSGRCEACRGRGAVRVEMHFLPDLWAPCEECGGRRFNRATLGVELRGKSIADVLDLGVDEAADFFAPFAGIARVLGVLQEVGLGYLPLGQPATTLSAGEARRLRLAAALAAPRRGETLYLLDEPAAGLHASDVHRLLALFHRLVDEGHTLVVAEHDCDVIRAADRVLDLGPGAGAEGGGVVAAGTPREIREAAPASITGRFLGGGEGSE